MKKTLFILIAILGLSLSASAQTLLSNTTLSAAVTTTQNSISVASASGTFTVVNNLLIIDGEIMKITAINGTTLNVLRAQQGTYAVPHGTSKTVLIGPAAAFVSDTSSPPVGSTCVRSQQQYLPLVFWPSGNVAVCQAGGSWTVTNWLPLTQNSFQVSH